jgi:hypothetical protein
MRILLIEDSWEDVADLYAEPLGEFRERLEKLNLEKLKEKLEPVEICWLVEINPRQGNAPTQEEIVKLRKLIRALRSGQIDNFPDRSRAKKIYRLLYPERNHDTERLLIADPGLEGPIDSNFPFRLGFSGDRALPSTREKNYGQRSLGFDHSRPPYSQNRQLITSFEGHILQF